MGLNFERIFFLFFGEDFFLGDLVCFYVWIIMICGLINLILNINYDFFWVFFFNFLADLLFLNLIITKKGILYFYVNAMFLNLS